MTLETSRTPGRRRHGGTAVKIVVTGPFSAGKTTLIRTISEITDLSTEQDITDDTRSRKAATTVAMDFGRISVDRDLVLYLFGTPGHERFDVMWEILGERMLGYILLVDRSRDESLAEAVGILVAFRRMARVPFVVALNRADGLNPADEQHVRAVVELDGETAVMPCDATNRESVKAVLLAVLYGAVGSLDDVSGPARVT